MTGIVQLILLWEVTGLASLIVTSTKIQWRLIHIRRNFEVVSAGGRDPDAEGVEGMSASKMRKAAAEDDFDTFE